MSLRDDLLPLVDECRTITEDLGQRTTALTVRTRTWLSGFVGKEQPTAPHFTDSDLVFPARYHIKNLSPNQVNQIISASAGRFQPGQYVKLWVTPQFSGGGYPQSSLVPSGSTGVEIIYVLFGSGLNGTFNLVTFNSDRPYRYELILRERNESSIP